MTPMVNRGMSGIPYSWEISKDGIGYMEYSKGDIIKFMDDSIAIVLDNGIKGKEFVVQYQGQVITLMSYSPILRIRTHFLVTDVCDDYVWYPVLIGDEHLWAPDENLYARVNGSRAAR